MKSDSLSPTVRTYFSAISIQRDDDSLARHGTQQPLQEAPIDFSALENRASDNDLGRAEFRKLFSARDGADTAANANLHPIFPPRPFAQRFDQGIVVAFAHCSVKIDDVQPFVSPKFV